MTTDVFQRGTSVWPYLRRYWPKLVRGSIGGIGYNTLIVLGPIFLGRALDATLALEKSNFSPPAYRNLYLNLFLLLISTIAFQGFRTLKRLDFRNMSNRIGNDLRSDLLKVSLSWPMPDFDKEKIGDLMSRAVGDVNQIVSTIMTTITEVYDTLVLIVSYFVACLYYEPRLTLLASIPQVVAILLAERTGSIIFRVSTETRQAASRVNSHLREQLQALRVLRAFGREEKEREILEKLSRQQLAANLRLSLLQGGLTSFYAVLSSLGIILVIDWGGRRVVNGQWTIGLFAAYLTLFSAMTARTLMAARVLNGLHAGKASWARVSTKIGQGTSGGNLGHVGEDLVTLRQDLTAPRENSAAISADLTGPVKDSAAMNVDSPTGEDSSAMGKDLTAIKGEVAQVVRRKSSEEKPTMNQPLVEFPLSTSDVTVLHSRPLVHQLKPSSGLHLEVNDLHFSFPGASTEAIAGITFQAKPGSFVALTGPIGSGKSALATVLTGLYPYRGNILFDGKELRDLPAKERERAVSFLDQNPFLFSATIKENVAFFREARGERLLEVLHLAGLKEDLEAFLDGVDTRIGEQGIRVSGGQRQRIALARALYRGSPLIILDDPFSAVDISTEQRIVQRIREAVGGSTLLLFSHRLSSFSQADQVLVLSGGRIIEAGTHTELLQREGLYARIFRAQEWLMAYGEDGRYLKTPAKRHRESPADPEPW